MWWLPVSLLAVVAMFALYILLDVRKHARLLEAERKAEIDETLKALEDALENHSDDLALHAALRARLERLRNEA